jgi:hypothetical protein
MDPTQSLTVEDLSLLQSSFRRRLLALNKSPRTIETYLEACRLLLQHLERQSTPPSTAVGPEHIEDFLHHLLRTRRPATASNRFRGL